MRARSRQCWGGGESGDVKQSTTIKIEHERCSIFDGGRLVVTRNNQPPSKLSTRARFRQWKGGGDVERRLWDGGGIVRWWWCRVQWWLVVVVFDMSRRGGIVVVVVLSNGSGLLPIVVAL